MNDRPEPQPDTPPERPISVPEQALRNADPLENASTRSRNYGVPPHLLDPAATRHPPQRAVGTELGIGFDYDRFGAAMRHHDILFMDAPIYAAPPPTGPWFRKPGKLGFATISILTSLAAAGLGMTLSPTSAPASGHTPRSATAQGTASPPNPALTPSTATPTQTTLAVCTLDDPRSTAPQPATTRVNLAAFNQPNPGPTPTTPAPSNVPPTESPTLETLTADATGAATTAGDTDTPNYPSFDVASAPGTTTNARILTVPGAQLNFPPTAVAAYSGNVLPATRVASLTATSTPTASTASTATTATNDNYIAPAPQTASDPVPSTATATPAPAPTDTQPTAPSTPTTIASVGSIAPTDTQPTAPGITPPDTTDANAGIPQPNDTLTQPDTPTLRRALALHQVVDVPEPATLTLLALGAAAAALARRRR